MIKYMEIIKDVLEWKYGGYRGNPLFDIGDICYITSLLLIIIL